MVPRWGAARCSALWRRCTVGPRRGALTQGERGGQGEAAALLEQARRELGASSAALEGERGVAAALRAEADALKRQIAGLQVCWARGARTPRFRFKSAALPPPRPARASAPCPRVAPARAGLSGRDAGAGCRHARRLLAPAGRGGQRGRPGKGGQDGGRHQEQRAGRRAGTHAQAGEGAVWRCAAWKLARRAPRQSEQVVVRCPVVDCGRTQLAEQEAAAALESRASQMLVADLEMAKVRGGGAAPWRWRCKRRLPPFAPTDGVQVFALVPPPPPPPCAEARGGRSGAGGARAGAAGGHAGRPAAGAAGEER